LGNAAPNIVDSTVAVLPKSQGDYNTIIFVFELPKEPSQAQKATFVFASLFVAYVNEP
jgi:hypothetical protein